MDNMFNFKGNNVEIFEYNGEILFNPRDVGECLGIVDVKSSIRNFSKTQKIKITNNDLKVHVMHFRKLHNTGETNRPISRYTEKLRDYLIEEFENVANN